MKKLFTTLAFCAATCAFAEPLWQAQSVKDFVNRRTVKQQEDGSFLATRSTWFTGKKFFPADPAKAYRISCEAKSADGSVFKRSFRIGAVAQDKNRRGAEISGLMPVKGTETELAAPLKRGDKVMVVKDASKWTKNIPTRIVYDADPSGQMRDIPNFDFIPARPASWNEINGTWEIKLVRAAGIDLPAGTVVRQHKDGRNAIYSRAFTVTGDWQKFEFVIGPGITADGSASNKIFPGVAFIAPVSTPVAGVVVRNYQMEEIVK